MRSSIVPTAFLLALVMTGNAGAAVMQEMQGAWAMDGTDCSDSFDTKDGALHFKDQGSSINSGIIVDGDKITGSNGTCTAGRVQRDKDRLTVAMSCADQIMFSTVSVSFRLINADSFVRYDPMFSDVLDTYHRCKP